MLERLIEHRDQLKQEYERSTQMVKQKEAELEELRATLTRITGAIQVMDEEIEEQRREAAPKV